MGVATLFNFPSTQEELNLWSFAHAAHHRDICRVVFTTRSVRLDEYVLDPFDPLNPGNWVALHQVMHQQFNAELGLSGFDLSTLSWKDEAQLQEWLMQNANEHYRVGSILGLG